MGLETMTWMLSTVCCPEKLTKSGRHQGRGCWDTSLKGLILRTRAEQLQAVGAEVFWVPAPPEEGV